MSITDFAPKLRKPRVYAVRIAPMGKAEEYRQRAEECERDAAKISFAPDRAALLEIAQRWREMADHAQTREEGRQGDE